MTKGLVFDVDGVIADTEHIWQAFLQDFFRQFDLELTQKHNDISRGAGIGVTVKIIADYEGLKVDWGKAGKEAEDYFLDRVGEVKIFPGVKPLIEQARRLEWKVATATSSARRIYEATIKQAKLSKDSLDFTIAGDEVTNKKPNPEIYLQAAEGLGLPASECVAIEDTANGVQSAKAAGMSCIGVTTSQEKEVLAEAGADWVFDSLENIDLEKLI